MMKMDFHCIQEVDKKEKHCFGTHLHISFCYAWREHWTINQKYPKFVHAYIYIPC
jgi:hypothetical protein